MTNPTSHPRTVLVALSCVLLCATTATPAAAGAQAKGAGKIHACVIKKGPDRGLMRLSHSKKCRKGEKALTWNKKGKAGAAGQAGPAGQTGPPGAPGGGAADSVESLRTQVEDQATRIADLETQLDQVTTQFTSFKTQACGQLDTLTDQSNAMGTALNLLGLGGTIPLGLTLVGENGAPASLPTFSC